MLRASKNLVWLMVLLLGLAACAPSPTPAPAATTPSIPSPAPAKPSSASTPTASPEEKAWAELVQAAKKEGVVNAYSFVLAGDVGKAVGQAFEERFGIKLGIISGPGMVTIERIKSEQVSSKYNADTFDSDTSIVGVAKAQGITQRWGELPALRETGVWYLEPPMDTEGHIMTIQPSIMMPYFNSSLLKPGQEPRSWAELAEPKWKGKLIVSPTRSNPLLAYVWVARDKLGLGEEWFRRLARQDLWLLATWPDSIRAANLGERPILVVGTNAGVGTTIAEGGPLRAVEVEEGIIGRSGSSMALVKNAPHPNAARLFTNFILSREGQIAYGQSRKLLPLRTDVSDYGPPGAMPKATKKTVWIDLALMQEVTKVISDGTVDKFMGLETR